MWNNPFVSLWSSEYIQDVLKRTKAKQLLFKLISAIICIKNIPMKQVPNVIYHHLHSHYHVAQFKIEELQLDMITHYNTKRCTPDFGNGYPGPGNLSTLEGFGFVTTLKSSRNVSHATHHHRFSTGAVCWSMLSLGLS